MNIYKLLSIVFLITSCSENSSLKTKKLEKYPMVIRATSERRLEWFQDGMTRADSGADSVEYSPDKLITYYDGRPTIFNGTVSVDTTLAVKEEMTGKRHEKSHRPIVYRNNVVEAGLPGDALEMIDSQGESYNCDSIYDYGNKIVGYYRSSRTLEFNGFDKNEVIMFNISSSAIDIKRDSLNK